MHWHCHNLRGQMFTHIDSKTKKQTVFAATAIREACDHSRLPLSFVPIERPVALMLLKYRGIEDYRLERAMNTQRWLPLLLAHMPDGTHLLIDGSHTYVARAVLGHRHAIGYVVPQELWCYYTIEGLPEEESEETLLNSWSGVL